MSDLELLAANPFLSNAVHESEIWAEEPGAISDVESIHRGAFDLLREDLGIVTRDHSHATRVRFLVGQGGAGKSHLFSRLRRSLAGGAIFVFASNPPQRPAALLPWILDKVIAGLRRPRVEGAAVKEYSQLEGLLLLLLRERLGLPDHDIDAMNAFWADVGDDIRADYLGRLHRFLVEKGYEPQSLRGLLAVMRAETRDVAFRWLGGSTNLMPEDLRAVGQAQPLEDEEGVALLRRLGELSRLAGTPIVLVLDQLDLMTEKAQVDAFQRLLFTLINESRNWYVVIGLIGDKYDLWTRNLTEALRTRLMATGGGVLPVIELTAIADPAERLSLLRQRLAAPALKALRAARGIVSETHPLDEDLQALAGGAPLFPRDLLTRASAAYVRRVEGKAAGPPTRESLEDRMRAEFDERRARLLPDQITVDKGAFADRLQEMLALLAGAEGLGQPRAEIGELDGEGATQGTHSVLTLGPRTIHLLTHHTQRGAAFPSFLARAVALPAGTILVRDGAVPITGPVTTRRLEEFRRDKHFVHLSRPAVADLYAMGEILAELREGNFATLATEPAPTPDNVGKVLAAQPWFIQHPFVQVARVALGLDRPSAAPPIARPPIGRPGRPEDTPPPAADLIAAIQAVLRSSQWLVLERLRLRLKRQHRFDVAAAELRVALAAPPLAEQILRYPTTVTGPLDVQILVWNADA
jgi:hypothetical protein